MKSAQKWLIREERADFVLINSTRFSTMMTAIRAERCLAADPAASWWSANISHHTSSNCEKNSGSETETEVVSRKKLVLILLIQKIFDN